MENLIQHIRGIVPISESGLANLTGQLTEKHFAKKDHLLRTNKTPDGVYFIVSGCIRTYVLDYNGVEHNISFSMEDWWCGDLQNFLKGARSTSNIQALENTTVLSLNRTSWDGLIEEVPEFVHYTRILFRNTMFAHENRILQSLSATAEERYLHFLTTYPDLAQRIPQKHIASYLGITPEFLSMLRARRSG